jgi:hypothetical protein
VLEFGRCITSIRAEFGPYASKGSAAAASSASSSAAAVAKAEDEASRRQFLGIHEAEDSLLDSTPLAPDDDIIINW